MKKRYGKNNNKSIKKNLKRYFCVSSGMSRKHVYSGFFGFKIYPKPTLRLHRVSFQPSKYRLFHLIFFAGFLVIIAGWFS